MKNKIWITCFVIGLFFSVGAPAQAADDDACLNCHKAIKTGKAGSKSVHAALEMGCSSCHKAPHAKKKPELSLVSEVPDLCFNCHDKSAFSKKYQHSPVAGGMCTSCHSPHFSNTPKLLTGGVPDLCYNCHDKGLFTKRSVHPPVADGQCTTCHSPHASDNPSVLAQPAAELCAMCHDKQSSGKHVLASFGLGDVHPVKGRPDPSRPGKELSCLSCHNPHSSARKTLFTNETVSPDNLCLLCHKKIMVRP